MIRKGKHGLVEMSGDEVEPDAEDSPTAKRPCSLEATCKDMGPVLIDQALLPSSSHLVVGGPNKKLHRGPVRLCPGRA